MKQKSIALFMCLFMLAGCASFSKNAATEKDKIQYIIAHQEDFAADIHEDGFAISIKKDERHGDNPVLVLKNDLGQEFGFYYGFEYVVQSNLTWVKGTETRDAQMEICRRDFEEPPRAEDAKPVFDVNVDLISGDHVEFNAYRSADFEKYQERFRYENEADDKIKAVLSAAELKALYDKGIAHQEWLFEWYAQSVSE